MIIHNKICYNGYGDTMEIKLKRIEDLEENYQKIYTWCSKKHVYEWFEQRPLTLEEIKDKYQRKIREGKQDLYFIQCDGQDIGFTQIYKYSDDISMLRDIGILYEFDLFIGEESYLHQGIGEAAVKLITKKIYDTYPADSIILRPFSRNTDAIACYEKCNYHVFRKYMGKDTLGNPEEITILMN